MSLIRVANLTFAYEGTYDYIFENAGFQIDTKWKLGFIGRNGRGKTTFLNLLLGKYPYSGTISSNVPFEYFPYEVPDKNEDTLEVVRSVCPQCEDWEIIRELSFLEADAQVLYRPFATLSNGEQTKVLLAALFLGSGRFLLIDEPTNHLDAKARKAVGSYLQRKQGFILVSHDRALLDSCIDHVLAINKTDIEVQNGNFSSWWHNRQLQEQYETAENEKLKKEIKRLSAAAKRASNWSDRVESSKFGQNNSGSKIDRGYVGHKSAKMMKRAKDIEKRQNEAAAEKAKLLHNVEEYDSLQIQPLRYHKELLMEAKEVELFYGEKRVCGGINLSVYQGERIALRGSNGSGKSTLLKLLCGESINYGGSLLIGSGLKVSYVSQDTSHLAGNLTDYAREKGIDESLFKAVLRKLDFQRVQFSKDMADFSGGQKKKVLIAASLCEKAHVYLWDEPLNFIDVFSRMQIEELILKFQPTLVFVEHDTAFCEKIATKTLSLGKQGE